MTIRPTPSSRPAAGPQGEGGLGVSSTLPPGADERVRGIAAVGERIRGHVQFLCQVDTLGGTSAAAKEAALAAFHERLAALERRLARIHDELQLG